MASRGRATSKLKASSSGVAHVAGTFNDSTEPSNAVNGAASRLSPRTGRGHGPSAAERLTGPGSGPGRSKQY